MPPKSKTQRKAPTANQELCCICLQKFGLKDQILFCSGNCQKYLHRYCASVSEQAFKQLSAEDAEPFLCYCCFRSKKEKQVETLLSTVESLKAEMDALKAASSATATSAASNTGHGDQPTRSPVHSRQTVPTAQATPGHSGPMSGENSSMSSRVLPNPDKKFNVVLYGVEECPSGMSISARFESDLSSAVKVFSSIHNSIEPQSIKDCFRLGKFSPGSSRPRPILVKFIRIWDVTGILTKRSNLSSPYVIKPDMPHEQRVRESALLKERWHLIQSGVHRSNIKIKKDRLFVSNMLHGSVVDNTFQHAADCLPIAMPNLEVSVPPKNVVDSPCIVEGNQESDGHVALAPTVVRETMPWDNAPSCSSDSCTPSVSLTASPSNTPPKPKES